MRSFCLIPGLRFPDWRPKYLHTPPLTRENSLHIHRLACRVAALALGLAAASTHADPVLGKVETLYLASSPHLLIELRPGQAIHGRPLVAEVRIRDANGAPQRLLRVRLADETIEAGDIVAIRPAATAGPLPARMRAEHRVAGVEAKHGTDLAKNFFTPPSNFVALTRAD